MESENAINLKQAQFNAAMALYESGSGYKLFGRAVSVSNLSLQALLLSMALPHPIGPWRQAAAFFVAFVLADFLNGLVHMIMDNRDDYNSLAGPLVAAFHLHHRTPPYAIKPLPVVYFNETGSKIWLVPFLGAGAFLAWQGLVPAAVVWAWFYFGVLSSIAELSHYCCHAPDTLAPRILRAAGIFMSKKVHARHHVEDNSHYTFLNGMTDPLVNLIARKWFQGYKNGTDRHFELYAGKDTENRRE